MLSIKDFREKQILFIKNEFGENGNNISFRNENIVFKKDHQIINQLSCSKVFSIFVIGDLTFSSVIIRKLVSYGISIFFLKRNFEVYASIGSQAEGNYLLRIKQYNKTKVDELIIAKNIVKNKLLNQIRLCKSNNKINYIKQKNKIIDKINNVQNEQELLGIEGNFTKIFFKSYFQEMDWYKRMPRTKVDHYNILLDIGYTFLLNYIDSLLRLYGFDVYKGVYHKLFFKRKSLSCDLVEPFRCIIDKQLLKSYRLKQINVKDFEFEKGKFVLKYNKSKKYLKIFFEAIINNKEAIFDYIHEYYRYIMKDGTVIFPNFKIK